MNNMNSSTTTTTTTTTTSSSSKPRKGDERSFIQLIEMDSKDRSENV